jgi:phytoene desaturase
MHVVFRYWFYQHAKDIYDEPRWPDEPLFYANFHPRIKALPLREWNRLFLVPLAPGINDTEALREEYFEKIMNRFESVTKQSVKKNI